MSATRPLAVLLAGALGACAPSEGPPDGGAVEARPAEAPRREMTASAGSVAAPAPLEVGPISYFENHCARCHGGYGSLYAYPFMAPDDELPRVVEEMCAGPAMAPLEGRPLEALTAYHIAMRDDVPFVAQVEGEGTGLFFEVTPGASLHFASGSGGAGEVDAGLWRVQPASAAFELEVRRGGERFDLAGWPARAWSAGRR